jgi:hypothetical protein
LAVVTTACGVDHDDASESVTTTSNALTSSPAIPAARDVPVEENLRRALPGASINMRNGRATHVHGPNLAAGSTPAASAEAFVATAREAFAAKQDDLRPLSLAQGQRTVTAKPEPTGLMFDPTTGQYKFSMYRYGQYVDGIPVHDAELVVLVKNEDNNPVVAANSSLRNIARFTPGRAPDVLAVDTSKSLHAVRAHAAKRLGELPAPASMEVVDQKELVIFAGVGHKDVPPRLAVRYRAGDSRSAARWSFVADAVSGEVLHTQSPAQAAAVWGTVRGNVTVNPIAADCAPETSTPLPYAEVGITGAASSFTSATGSFWLSAGTTPVQAYSTLLGRWIDVTNYGSTDEILTSTVTPPASVSFLHNAADNQESVIAQANAYYHVNLARDFLLRYLPNYPYISTTEHYEVIVNGDETTPGYHGMTGLCPGGAWAFEWHQLLFCKAGNGVRNAAFGTIAYHEFGHEVVLDGGGGAGEYSEGMADAYALLMTGDPRLGIGLQDADCTNVRRDARSPVCLYDPDPEICSSNCGVTNDAHGCGRLLSGIVWDIREAYRAKYPDSYQDKVNALVLSSIPKHIGTGIDGEIAIDMLELDDNDGNIYNGTPNSAEICGAFARHGISCPTAPQGPCADLCNNPVTFSWNGSYQSGPLGTGTICRQTTQALHGGNCGNFAPGRTLSVNGTVMPCNYQNWSSPPTPRNGGYCVTTTPGNYPWAFFTMW